MILRIFSFVVLLAGAVYGGYAIHSSSINHEDRRAGARRLNLAAYLLTIFCVCQTLLVGWWWVVAATPTEDRELVVVVQSGVMVLAAAGCLSLFSAIRARR